MLPLLVIVLTLGLPARQVADITGIWAGDARMPGISELDHLTLVIEQKGDSYSGKMSDRLGVVRDEPLRNVSYKNGNLRFKATVRSGGTDINIDVGLNYYLGKLIGGWGTSTGDFAPLDLVREKQKTVG